MTGSMLISAPGSSTQHHKIAKKRRDISHRDAMCVAGRHATMQIWDCGCSISRPSRADCLRAGQSAPPERRGMSLATLPRRPDCRDFDQFAALRLSHSLTFCRTRDVSSSFLRQSMPSADAAVARSAAT